MNKFECKSKFSNELIF